MKFTILLIPNLILLLFSLPAQVVHPNFRIYPSQVTQTEPTIAVSPVDPMRLFASARTININIVLKSEGVYVSTDGGQDWFGSDTCTGELIINHGGDPGVAITSNNRLIITHIGDPSFFPGVYSHYSTDLGATWSDAYTIFSGQVEDKGSITMDSNPASPHYGRIYAAWVNFNSPFPVFTSYSTNSGQSWTQAAAINNPPPRRCSGGSITTGPDGKVYIVWAGVEQTAPFIEDFAGFARSTDGGNNWIVSQNIFDMNGINGILSSKSNIRVNGLPQVTVDNSGGVRQGWIYIVTTEQNIAPAGSDPDILLHRSTDGGATWSAGIRVNQDPLNNGKVQYFPAMDIDADGGINIIYYDDRNTASDSAEMVLARSEDGGDTWSDLVISDHRFKPKPIIGGASNYQGDHIALLSVGNKLYALWMDDFSGIYQVWMAIIDLEPNAVEEPKGELPTAIELFQNYPNPFNPQTTIEFSLTHSAHTRLEVFDVMGKSVITLIDRNLPAGKHRVHWDAANQPSGIYFCRLQTGATAISRKMILLR